MSSEHWLTAQDSSLGTLHADVARLRKAPLLAVLTLWLAHADAQSSALGPT